jgi:hypothetical protein|tara:strand:+ start:148 stop:621 length:474 start_codon:yes stop_codon:yes gene_type:complete
VVNSRQKGAKAEALVANMLTRHTQLPFVGTPGSGSGKIKGDLYLTHKINKFLIEVKFYRDDAVTTKIFTNKSNNFVQWWAKARQQAELCNQEPLLFFKANHAQFFVSTVRKPQKLEQYMHLPWLDAYICLAEKWLEHEKQEWTHGDRIYEPWKPSDS